jgi:hypothetical protein
MAGSPLTPAAAERPSPTVPNHPAPGLPDGPRRFWARSRTWLVVVTLVILAILVLAGALLRSGGGASTETERDPAAVTGPAAELPPGASATTANDGQEPQPADEDPTATVDRPARDAAGEADEGASGMGPRSSAEADRSVPTFDQPAPVVPPPDRAPPPTSEGPGDASADASAGDGPVPSLAARAEQSLVVVGPQRFRLQARADQVLGVTADDPDGGSFQLILRDEADSLRAIAMRGPLDADGARSRLLWSQAVPEELWFWFEQDGSYELSVSAEEQPGEPFTVQLRDVVAPPRTVVDVTERFTAEGDLPTFGFDGRAGQLAVIDMAAVEPWSLDAVVRLYDPDGALLGETADGGGGLDARLHVRLRDPGGHLVAADSFTSEAAGSGRDTGAAYRLVVRLAEIR